MTGDATTASHLEGIAGVLFGTAIQINGELEPFGDPNSHDSIPLPSPTQDAVNSWQRTIAACRKEHRRAKYQEACVELLRLADDQFHSDVSQSIIDRLSDMGRANGISDDDAQGIMARARAGGQSEQDSRIRLVPFAEITLSTARRYLVKDLVPRVGMTVVWGPPKCGKSFWVFDLMMHVALGRTYRGRRVHQGPVVYCAFEGQTGIEARVAAFRATCLADHTEHVPFYLEPVTLDLVRDHAALIAAIRQQLGETVPVAVTLDTLNRSLAGSESSDEDMSAYVRAADAVREAFSCAVIIVHHCGHNDTRPRGHSSLAGALDAQLAVTRDAANNILVTIELMKDGSQGETIASKLDVVTVGVDEDGDDITSCVVTEAAESVTRRRAVNGWPANLRLFRDALNMAITANAVDHVIAGDGPRVRAALVSDVREQYSRSYVSGGDGDPAAARRQAFKRNIAHARERGLISGETSQGRELVWTMSEVAPASP